MTIDCACYCGLSAAVFICHSLGFTLKVYIAVLKVCLQEEWVEGISKGVYPNPFQFPV